ncbi:MAG: type III PLP-dependent enzyme [Pseudomonadota bacterium]
MSVTSTNRQMRFPRGARNEWPARQIDDGLNGAPTGRAQTARNHPGPAGALRALTGAAAPVFKSIAEALRWHDSDDPVFVLYPDKIATAARSFLATNPGETLYAVKANPSPAILRMLWAEGVRRFDIASMRELEFLKRTLPDAHLYLMHPVKSRRLIARSYALGVRDYAFDSAEELEKIIDETGGAADLNLHLRLALPRTGAVMPLTGKFGAGAHEAVRLAATARSVAKTLGVCFHVGSQCLDPGDYVRAIAHARRIVEDAGVAIDTLDVGGGFAVSYPGYTAPKINAYFEAIAAAMEANGLANVALLAEPGRALVAEGGSSLIRVELRKQDALYLNDGAFGSLFDAAHFGWRYPTRLHRDARSAGETDDGVNKHAFKLFGPTCDSEDAIRIPIELPEDIREGDWIEFQHLGAYGQSLSARFNGFYSETTVCVLDCA